MTTNMGFGNKSPLRNLITRSHECSCSQTPTSIDTHHKTRFYNKEVNEYLNSYYFGIQKKIFFNSKNIFKLIFLPVKIKYNNIHI